MEIILLACACGVLVLLPIRWLAVLLGVLLPVDFVAFTDPIALDALRYAVSVILIVRSGRDYRRQPLMIFLGSLLTATAIVTLVSGISSNVERLILTGISGVASTILAMLIVGRSQMYEHILRGLAFGVALSALDAIMQWAGLPFVGTPSSWGQDFSGFGASRTQAAPYFALGFLLFLAPSLWVKRSSILWMSLRGLGGCLSLVGLILSAGRAGFLAFGIGLLLWGIRSAAKSTAIVFVVALGVVGVLYWQRSSFLAERLFALDSVGSGRNQLNRLAFDAFVSSPLFGPDPSQPLAEAGSRAHTPILGFAVNAGVIGFVAGIFGLIVISVAIYVGLRDWRVSLQHAVLLCVVAAVTTVFEPTGFFVGLGRTLPLFIALQIILSSVGTPTSNDHSAVSGTRTLSVGKSKHRHKGVLRAW